MLVKYIAALVSSFSRAMSRIRSLGKRDAELWDVSDVPEIKIFQKKTKDGRLVDWLTPEKLFVRQDILILSLDTPAPPEGLVARCYADGQLKFLGFYKEGTCDYYWSITLEHGVEKGCAKRYPIANDYGDCESEAFNDGCSIRYDAWSDNSSPYEIDYDVWVRSWVKRIAGDVKAP